MIKFENKLNGRFYYVEIKKDLFEDVVIHIRRGGRNALVERLIFCSDARAAREELRIIHKRRIERGYTLV